MKKLADYKTTLAVIALAAGLFIITAANANEKPFQNDATASNILLASHHGEGKGHKMKMMDTDGDGAISKEEFMSHKEERFNKKDENGDGVLTEDEMKKHCKHHKEKAPKEE